MGVLELQKADKPERLAAGLGSMPVPFLDNNSWIRVANSEDFGVL